MVGKGINWKLLNTSAVTALVGNRIYAEISDENQYPLVAYAIENQTEDYLDCPAVTQKVTATITSVSYSYKTTQQLSAAVKAAINRQTGNWNGVVIQSVSFQDQSEDTISESSNAEKIFYTVEQKYTIFFYLT